MKKIVTITVMLLAIMSCSSKFGKGGDNAAQYVREQMPELVKDAVSVEAVNTDTISVYDIDTLTKELESKNLDVELGIATDKELTAFADSISRFGEVRIVYIVTIIAKSSKKEDVKVVMEKDGETPYMLYDEYEKLHIQFIRKVAEYEIPVVEIEDIEGI